MAKFRFLVNFRFLTVFCFVVKPSGHRSYKEPVKDETKGSSSLILTAIESNQFVTNL